jgi:hypothetical protein
MTVEAWLLGDPGRTPFAGHFRGRAALGDAWIEVVGRIGSDNGIVDAFPVARSMTNRLTELTPRASALGAGRHALARALWQIVLEPAPPPADPSVGGDLSLLFVSGDQRGLSVGGVGLAGVWRRDAGAAWASMVPRDHPLLSSRGIPPSLPGVLALDLAPEVICAAPRPLEADLPPIHLIAPRCGVRV